MNLHEVKFLSDFQPIGAINTSFGMIFGTALNWAALYGVFFVIGVALKHGMGN